MTNLLAKCCLFTPQANTEKQWKLCEVVFQAMFPAPFWSLPTPRELGREV